MAKKKPIDGDDEGPTSPRNGDARMLRAPAEVSYAHEIDALIAGERHERPPGWKMSARSVLTYICGGKCGSLEITPKYIRHQRLRGDCDFDIGYPIVVHYC